MNQSEYQQFIEKYKNYKSNNLAAFIISLTLLSLGLFLIYFSAIATGFLWFLSQLALGVVIIQWFFLLHDLGHDHFFSYKPLNRFFGLISSLFCILPFYPWRYIHRTHHLWTGWKDKDPTMTIIIPREVPNWKKQTINFCWKYWIPVFTLSFSFANFWNVPKLNRMFPDKKFNNYISILLPLIVHGLAWYWFGNGLYAKSWGIAFLTFLTLCDPLLLSQHTSIPQHHTKGEKVNTFHFREQDQFTRSLIFPSWMGRFIFFGFNNHILHHLIPTMPGYQLARIKWQNPNDRHWWQWLKAAKKTNGFDLLLSEELNLKND